MDLGRRRIDHKVGSSTTFLLDNGFEVCCSSCGRRVFVSQYKREPRTCWCCSSKHAAGSSGISTRLNIRDQAIPRHRTQRIIKRPSVPSRSRGDKFSVSAVSG